MGIRKYHNRFRAYFTDSKGEAQQLYFDSKKEAEEHIVRETEGRLPLLRVNKKSNAKAKDLPVGLCDTFEVKTPRGIAVTYSKIVAVLPAHLIPKGHPKSRHRYYGGSRTREEAIKQCLQWRTDTIVLIATPSK